jgi:hypothetical protein
MSGIKYISGALSPRVIYDYFSSKFTEERADYLEDKDTDICVGMTFPRLSKVVGGCTTVLPVPWRVILASAASRFETGAVKTFPTPPAMKAPPDGPVAGRAAGAAGFEAIPEP